MLLSGLLFVLPALLIFAAVSDMLTMKISNYISIALVAGFCVASAILRPGWEAFLYSLSCGLFILAITFFLFVRGWIGGGDAKLASAAAVWFGWSHLMAFLLVASVFGGALTIALLLFRRMPLPMFLMRQAWIERLHAPRGGIPYGIALAAAGVYLYPQTQFWTVMTGA